VAILGVLLAYVIGSVPFAFLLARQWGTPDLHVVGSGNIGASNVWRTAGARAGILVALLDIGKGAASVWVAARIHPSAGAAAAAGVAAVVGHIYPVWLKFRGGKGVATACGAFAVLAPVAMLPSLAIFLGGAWVTKYVSIGSVLATAALPSLAFAFGSPRPTVVAAITAAALIVFRHRSNLARVWKGTERRAGARF
jgi:glycerol-3-phosphate acyltransferase PlsY